MTRKRDRPEKPKSHKKGMGKFHGIAGYSGGRPSQAANNQLRSSVRREQNSQHTLRFQVIFIFLLTIYLFIIYLFFDLFICLLNL